MYIEYTPLEGHLHTILRNPATAAALLEHVEAEEAGTQVLHVQAEAAEDAAVAYRISAPAGGGGARVTDPIEDQAHFTIKPRRSAKPEHKLSALDVDSHVLEADDEDEEEYELFDVIDAGDVVAEELVEHPRSVVDDLCTISQNCAEKVVVKNQEDRETTPNRIVIELEDEDFEYVVTRVPKSGSSVNSSIDEGRRLLNQAKSTPLSGPKRKRRSRILPPVPAALPIVRTRNSSSNSVHRTKSGPGLRLLNGNFHNYRRTTSQGSFVSNCSTPSSSNSCVYVQRPVARRTVPTYGYSTTARYYNQLASVDDEEDIYDEEQFELVPDEQFEEEEDDVVPVSTLRRAQESQMGIDIFNKLRSLLNFNSSSNYDTSAAKRKRRCDDWSSDAADVHQIKYRKVDNHFPKFITGPLDNDDIDCFPFPKKPEKPLLLQQHRIKTPLVMSQRRSIHSIENPKQRKSIFVPPTTTHKFVKNRSYADVEFSDDDEPELINGFGYAAAAASGSSLGNVAKIRNIPISHREEERIKFSGKPPPPLIEARTGSILASSLVRDLKPSRPTYADALRQNLPIGHVLGRAPSTVSSSGASTSASARGLYNGFSSSFRNHPCNLNSRSVIMRDKVSDDREKYEELLKQMVPRIYGNDDGSLSPTLKSLNNLNSARRRSGLLAGAAATSTANNTLNANSHTRSLTKNSPSQISLKRPPLSSTINLDDDDDDVALVSIDLDRQKSRPKSNNLATVIIDDDDLSDIIDLGEDDRNMLSNCSKSKIVETKEKQDIKDKENIKKKDELPYVEPVNSLEVQFSTCPHLKENWLENWQSKWEKKKKERKEEALKFEKEVKKHTEERRAAEHEIQERLKNFQFFSPDLVVLDDFPEPIEDDEPEFIELNDEYRARINSAICGPPDQVLVSKFNLNITRRDIHTLLGNNWLNDEVINFYMNLLTERGEKKHKSHNMPTVYAMNTFFVPRLMQNGHGGVKRWTRKVDIFAKDIIPVPVHVGGVHWCMAIIHLKNRTIKYYDSMGTPNPNVLKALEQYLKDESKDKRNTTFDTSQFEIESVRDVPRQMNGSDCGVFSCMFAEYITRNKEITFSQQHMEYFRHKMILEIVQGELLQ